MLLSFRDEGLNLLDDRASMQQLIFGVFYLCAPSSVWQLSGVAAPRARVSRHSVLSVGCSAQKTNLNRQPCARASDTREAVSGDTRVECRI